MPDPDGELLSLVDRLRAASRMDVAIATLRKALRIHPDWAAAQAALADTLVEKGCFRAAIAAYRRAVRIAPANREWRLALEDVLVLDGKLEQAVTLWEEAVRAAPEVPATRHLLRIARIRAGLSDDHGALRETLRDEPDGFRWLIRLGHALMYAGRGNETVTALETAVRLAPENSQAHAELGAALGLVDRQEEAIAACFTAVRLDPQNPTGNLFLCLNLRRAGRNEELLAERRRYVHDALPPEAAIAHLQLARALMDAGESEEALPHYREALHRFAEGPGDLDAQFVPMVGALEQSRNWTAMLTLCQDFARLRPRCAEAHAYLGHALIRAGHSREGIAAYRECRRLAPDRAWTGYWDWNRWHWRVGRDLQEAGDLDAEIDIYREAVAETPDDARAHTHLGVALLRASRVSAGCAAIRQATRIDPKAVEVHWWLAAVSEAEGRLADAIASYRELVSDDPTNPWARYSLGCTLEVAGEADEAVAAYRATIQLVPDEQVGEDPDRIECTWRALAQARLSRLCEVRL